MLNSTDDKTIAKLKQILASRYGKGLQLRTLTSVTDEAAFEGHVLQGQDLLIPLRIKDAFLGTAVIPAAEELSAEVRTQITQMVRMILEPALYRGFLERREGNLRRLSEEGLDASNLRILGEGSASSEADFETEEEESSDALKMDINLVHLHGQDPQRIKKAALLLHEMTGRWAFVPFKDVQKDIHSVTDLLNLGAMTLFVEDVKSLSEASQKLILDYLSSSRSDRQPLFVTASVESPEQLVGSSLLSEFTDEIAVSSLELDRAPMSEKGLREVINLMFFTLAGEA